MKQRIAIFMFLSVIVAVQAQQHSFSDQFLSTYRFSFIAQPTLDERNTNYVLQQISFNNSIPSEEIKLLADYVFEVKVTPSSKLKTEVLFQLQVARVRGNTKIQKLDVTPYLSPQKCSFEYRLYNRNTGEVYEQALLRDYLKDGKLVLRRNVFADLTAANLAVDFYGLIFHYSNEDIVRLKSQISMIDDYYSTVFLADKLLEEAKTWNADEPRTLVWNYFKSDEFGRFYNFIEQKDFVKCLGLLKNDPAGLIEKMDELNRMKRRLNTLMKDAAEATRLYLPNEKMLAQEMVKNQQQYIKFLDGSFFNNSLLLDELLTIKYSNHFFANIHAFFAKGLDENQKQQLKNYFGNFMLALRDEHLKSAEEMLQAQNYMRASIQIKNAASLQKRLNRTDNQLISMMHSRAIYGLYHSYLRIAHRALSVSNIDMSRLYLNKSVEFQLGNNDVIQTQEAVINGYKQLVDVILVKSSELKDSEKYPEATGYLMEAVDIVKLIKANEIIPKINTRLNEIYQSASKKILELDKGLSARADENVETNVGNQLLRLKNSQQIILDQIQRLNAE